MLKLKTLLLSIFLCLISFTKGQTQSFQKKIIQQDSSTSSIFNLEYTDSGHLWLGGTTVRDGSFFPFFQKIDMSGNILWTKEIAGLSGTPNISTSFSILPDQSIVTSILSSQNFLLQLLVLKLSPDGNTVDWVTQIGDHAAFLSGTKLTLTDELGILSAHYNSNNPFILTHLNLDGNINWSYSYHLDNYISRPTDMKKTSDTTYLVSSSNGNQTSQNANSLIWLDINGTILKSKNYQNAVISSIDIYPNEDILISGKHSDNLNNGVFFSRTNNQGDIIWAKKIKNKGTFLTSKALLTDDGGTVIFFTKTLSDNNYQIIIKLDSQGNIEWQRRLNESAGTTINLGVIAGTDGYVSFRNHHGQETKAILTKMDLLGNVDNCPMINSCLEIEDIIIDTLSLQWQKEAFTVDSASLNLSMVDMNMAYENYCEEPIIPIADFLIKDTVCVNDCITVDSSSLQQQTADAWEWSGANIEFPDALNPREICFLDTGIFEIQQIIYYSGCTDTFATHVVVNPIPPINLGDDITICNDSSLFIDATSMGNITYLWDDMSSIPIREIFESGIYAVTISDGICTNQDDIEISFIANLFEQENFELGEDTTICTEDSYWLGIDENIIDDFLWSDGYTETPRLINSSGTYIFTATVNGCLFLDSINIEVNDCIASIYIPNAFSPNGDNINDTFTAYGNHHVIQSLKIFNRWGGILWSGNTAWDGMVKGQKAQTGVYVYLLEYLDTISGKLIVKSGDITLLK